MKELEPGDLVGAYRIVRTLGRGGMGCVYEAEHVRLGARRAVKVFAVDGPRAAFHRDRFLAEGKVLAALDHPGIVRMHEFELESAAGGRPYLTMDLVLSPDGSPRTLEDDRCEGGDERRLAAWLRDVGEALAYVHAHGIAHRDVKLENVLVGPGGRAVLTDFGIAHVFDATLRTRLGIARTRTGDEVSVRGFGSVCYMAPELRGENPAAATPASDAWALGVLVFRYLTGFWFEHENRDRCLELLDDCELPWRPVVERLCDPDPNRRLADGGFASLSGLVAGPIRDATPSSNAAEPPSDRFPLLSVAALALAGLALFAVAAVIRSAADRQPPETPAEPPPAPVRADGPTDGIPALLEADDPRIPTWREYAETHFAADAALLPGPDVTNAVVREFLERQVARGRSVFPIEAMAVPQTCREADDFVAEELARPPSARRLGAAQLLCLAGESFVLKRRWTRGGDFPTDRARLADLAAAFLGEHPSMASDPEWVFSVLGRTGVAELREAYARVADDAALQRLVDPWVLCMWKGCHLHREAWRARQGKPWCEMSDEAARTFSSRREEAARAFAEADGLAPERYASRLAMLRVSLGDAEAATRWFERCLRCCRDDLRAWNQYAYSLTHRWGGPEGALERLLEMARTSARDDTWVPAFAVIGRWNVLATFERTFKPQDADGRRWAYADAAVRTNELAAIRRALASPAFEEADGRDRVRALSVFAAVALACGDEELAENLVKRLPARELRSIDEAAEGGTEVNRRLEELYWKDVDRWAVHRDDAIAERMATVLSMQYGVIPCPAAAGTVTNVFNLGVGTNDFQLMFRVSPFEGEAGAVDAEPSYSIRIGDEELGGRRLGREDAFGFDILEVRGGRARLKAGKFWGEREVPFGSGDITLVLSAARLSNEMPVSFHLPERRVAPIPRQRKGVIRGGAGTFEIKSSRFTFGPPSRPPK